MNKRADISVTVLVIGVLFVCFLAILSFYLNALDVRGTFTNIKEINKVNIQYEFETGQVQEDNFGKFISEKVYERRHWYSLSSDKLILEIKRYV